MTACKPFSIRFATHFLLAVGLAAGAATPACAGDDPIVDAARQLMQGASTRGAWHNPLAPEATGTAARPRSADEIMNEQIAHYSRQVLDQGGWVNPYVPGPGYDVGNPLYAVRPGEGVSLGG